MQREAMQSSSATCSSVEELYRANRLQWRVCTQARTWGQCVPRLGVLVELPQVVQQQGAVGALGRATKHQELVALNEARGVAVARWGLRGGRLHLHPRAVRVDGGCTGSGAPVPTGAPKTQKDQ